MAENNTPSGGRRSARTPTEQALNAEQVGDQENVDQLLAEERIEPNAADIVLAP